MAFSIVPQNQNLDILCSLFPKITLVPLFVRIEVLRLSQPSGVMSRAVNLPNHTFIGQASSSKQL